MKNDEMTVTLKNTVITKDGKPALIIEEQMLLRVINVIEDTIKRLKHFKHSHVELDGLLADLKAKR